MTGLSCPSCGMDGRVIDHARRTGPYPEMLTLKCMDCGEIFSTPEDSDRRLPDISTADFGPGLSPLGTRAGH